MKEHLPKASSFNLSACNREGKRSANQKGKCRLNQVMQRAALPRNMLGIKSNDIPEPAMGKVLRDLWELRGLIQHQQHHGSAEHVERNHSSRKCLSNWLRFDFVYRPFELRRLDHGSFSVLKVIASARLLPCKL